MGSKKDAHCALGNRPLTPITWQAAALLGMQQSNPLNATQYCDIVVYGTQAQTMLYCIRKITDYTRTRPTRV
jgi:hypothetical protein